MCSFLVSLSGEECHSAKVKKAKHFNADIGDECKSKNCCNQHHLRSLLEILSKRLSWESACQVRRTRVKRRHPSTLSISIVSHMRVCATKEFGCVVGSAVSSRLMRRMIEWMPLAEAPAFVSSMTRQSSLDSVKDHRQEPKRRFAGTRICMGATCGL